MQRNAIDYVKNGSDIGATESKPANFVHRKLNRDKDMLALALTSEVTKLLTEIILNRFCFPRKTGGDYSFQVHVIYHVSKSTEASPFA